MHAILPIGHAGGDTSRPGLMEGGTDDVHYVVDGGGRWDGVGAVTRWRFGGWYAGLSVAASPARTMQCWFVCWREMLGETGEAIDGTCWFRSSSQNWRPVFVPKPGLVKGELALD
jgi:hypothetical protein